MEEPRKKPSPPDAKTPPAAREAKEEQLARALKRNLARRKQAAYSPPETGA